MKKLIFILLLIFISCTLQAQSTWITMLPDTGSAAKMIRTNDSKFLALCTNYINGGLTQKVALCKINNNGMIDWYKTYCSDTTGYFEILDIKQFSNNNILIAGAFASYPFLLMTNEFGDSLWEKRFPYYPLGNKFESIIEYSSNEFWLMGGGPPSNLKYVHKFNFSGQLLEVDSSSISIPAGPAIYGNKMIKLNNDTLLFTKGNGYFIYTDFSLNILKQVHYSVQPLLVLRLSNKNIMIHDDTYYNPQIGYYNGKGLVSLSANLDSLFKVEFTQYYNYSAVMHAPNDMQLHTGNGLVMCGDMWWNDILSPYFMVLDSTYHSTVIKMFSGVVPDRAMNVFEEPDSGFVILQYSSSSPYKRFVVKVNNQGNFTSVENNEYFTSNSLKMLIFPNPASNEFTVRFSNKVTGMLYIYNLNGILIEQEKVDMVDEINLYLNSAPQGIYIVSLLNEQNKVVTREQLIIK